MSGGFPVKILNIISIERHQYSNRIGASRFRFSKVKNILILHKKSLLFMTLTINNNMWYQ